MKISGRVDTNSATLPGTIEYRFAQLQEIKAILDYMRILLEQLEYACLRVMLLMKHQKIMLFVKRMTS